MIRGVILASGESRRMGAQKLLLPLKGHTIVEEVIENAKESSLSEILLVYGEPKGTFYDICKKHNISGIYNGDYKLGQSQSIIKGITGSEGVDGFLFLLGDQPFVKPDIIDSIILESEIYPSHIIVPVYNEKRGNPVFFPAGFKDELIKLTGDTGGREILMKYADLIRNVEIASPDIFFDIDNVSDYTYAKEKIEHYSTT